MESWQYQLLWGGCCCQTKICALLGCWQSLAFPPELVWDPGSAWGRAGGSPIAFLAPSGRPSWLPAAEQLCQPEAGLVWGNKDQMPHPKPGFQGGGCCRAGPPEPRAGVRAVLPLEVTVAGSKDSVLPYPSASLQLQVPKTRSPSAT